MTSTHHAKDQRIFEKECVSLAQAGFKVYLLAQGKNEKEKYVESHGRSGR